MQDIDARYIIKVLIDVQLKMKSNNNNKLLIACQYLDAARIGRGVDILVQMPVDDDDLATVDLEPGNDRAATAALLNQIKINAHFFSSCMVAIKKKVL